jgi:hypothetical protein
VVWVGYVMSHEQRVMDEHRCMHVVVVREVDDRCSPVGRASEMYEGGGNNADNGNMVSNSGRMSVFYE